MKKGRRYTYNAYKAAAFSIAVLLCYSAPSFAQNHVNGSEPLKRVLYINSYHTGFAWSDSIADGINMTLDGHADVFVEYMDAKRENYGFYKNIVADMIAVKYQRTPVDLVITSDDAAFEFVTENKDTLFKDIPVVTSGINFMSEEILSRCPKATGVKEGGEPIRTVQLALSLFPKTEKIIFITDWQATKRTLPEITKVELALGGQYSYHHIIEEPTTTLENIVAQLNAVEESSIVILFGLIQTRHRQFTEEYVMKSLNETGLPFFTFYHRFIQQGALGGMAQDAREQGKLAADMAIKLLDGKQIEEVPPNYHFTGKPVFNYEMLHRFGISSKALPEDALIIGEPDSRIIKYRNYLLIGIVFIIVQMVMIASLLRANRLRRQATTDLKEAKHQAETASQAKSEFLMIISHEMRTPLNAVAGFSELLAEEEHPETRTEYIGYIKNSCTALLTVINDILTFTNAKQLPQKSRTNVCNIVDDLCELVEDHVSTAEDKGIQLEFVTRCSQDLQPLLNWEYLQIATSKLIENAIEYSDNGTVQIVLEEVDAEKNRMLLISIIDHGKGIAEENIEKLFEAFQQADTSLKREHQGIGLGLAICRRLITIMGGTLHCKSKLNEGSKFQIQLPLAEAA